MTFSLKWIKEHLWLLLLLAIMSLLVISPLSEIFDQQDNVISPLTAVILLAVTFGTTEKARTAWLLATLIVAWLIISIVTDGSGLFAGVSLLAPMLFMVLLIAIFILLARWLIRAVHIDAEVLCAAICGYLIIGILWTGIYSAAIVMDPKALVSTTDPKLNLSQILYFSYATLTTTGFGDIVPKNPHVRMLAIVEAIVGLFYNTIVIARFVGLYGLKRDGPISPAP